MRIIAFVAFGLLLLLIANLAWTGLRLGHYAELHTDGIVAKEVSAARLSLAGHGSSEPEMEIDVARALGSDAGVSSQRFTIYLPSRDRNGKEIDNPRKWVLEAAKLLSEINGGATVMPSVEGGWLNDEGELVWESATLVYSFIRPTQFEEGLPRLREFLARLGRDTNQGEVVFEFNGRLYRIHNFDGAKDKTP
jgi:hypothetical protein